MNFSKRKSNSFNSIWYGLRNGATRNSNACKLSYDQLLECNGTEKFRRMRSHIEYHIPAANFYSRKNTLFFLTIVNVLKAH